MAFSATLASAQTANLSIPSQSLALSLRAVAQATGENILFAPDAVSGLNGPALSGALSAQQAVARLIAGTGLEVVGDGKGGLIVRRPFPEAAANADVPDAPVLPIETVIVSASRISLRGYTAPTPVTVISGEQLDRDAKMDIGDAIRELPQVTGGSANTGNNGVHGVQGDAGVDTINLRNLGDNRTLTLFDGQRVVSSSPAGGGADLTTIPASLIRRIDVVTGGASAAWGSDALSGVVDLVLNKTFTGQKANLEFSDTGQDDHRQFKAELSIGTDVLGDRGHVIVSGSYIMSPDTVFLSGRDWWNPVTLIPNPAGSTPAFVHRGNFGSANFTQGGIITASAAGVPGPGVTTPAAANALRGIQFLGAGVPAPFSYGTLPVTNGNCYDCSATKFTGNGAFNILALANHSATLFGYAGYRLTDGIKLSVQLNYGHSFVESVTSSRTSTITVTTDNPYLDPGIAARMVSGGIASFSLGTNNNNDMDVSQPSFRALENSLSTPVVLNTRDLARAVFTLEGALGNDWSWIAYVQHSQVRISQYNPNNSLTSAYNNAVDAVRVTPANVGASGFSLGQIVCRSSLTAPGNGCVPLDVFGIGVASDAALNYIEPGRRNGVIEDQAKFNLNQDVASATVQGTLPWGFAAGKTATAAGLEYRLEQQTDIADPAGLGDQGAWQSANYNHFQAHYDVMEGFGEITVPLLRQDVVKSADFNAAGRITSYSNSGLVETWKLGITAQIDDDFRLRSTYSTDIRAPAIAELYLPPLLRMGNLTDPRSGNLVGAPTISAGNPDLVPEVAKTISGGLVVTPTFLPGLSMSADWFSISIHNAIFMPNSAQVLAQCAAGVTYYCGQEVFAGPINSTGLPAGIGLPALSAVYNRPLNAAAETTSGLDFEADYHTLLFDGVFSAHAISSYNDERTRTAVGATNDCAGQLGGDAPCQTTSKLRFNLSASYAQGPWAGTVQLRYFGSARLVNGWVSGVNVDKNAIPAVAYLDLRTSYKWGEHLQLYANASNLTDVPPPNVPSTTGAGGTNTQYDQLGRTFSLGIRYASL